MFKIPNLYRNYGVVLDNTHNKTYYVEVHVTSL